ncbi:MAG TPA: GNVR domain-containing protein [Thiobacillaceae bacterium]|nr:GNVR domain-containing protein [Thiobacillaceae bacterium]HNU64912.1 GNVR domain-containing protein [Thiobacillaceae bacterium]
MNEGFEQVLGYVRGIWRRRLMVLGIAWFISIVGWVWVYLLENQYQAQARVYVDTQSLLRPLLSGLAVQPNVGQQVSMMTRTLMSRPNLEKVARMTDLDLRAKTTKQQEELYREMESRISLAGTDRENLYTITYQHSNPDLAKRIVQSLLTIFTESSLGGTRKDLSTSQRFIDDQLKGYEAKLLEKEKALEDFKRRNVGSLPGQGGDYYAKVGEVNAALEQARFELEEAVNRKKQLEAQLQDQEETVTAPTPVTPTTTALDGRIAALQSQLDNLRLRYTDMHPEIARTKQLIARIEEQKRQEEQQVKGQSPAAIKAQNPIYQQLTIAIAEADANAASLRARVAQLQGKRNGLMQAVDRIPQIEAEYTQLTRDYGVLRDNYTQLLNRRETASISSEVESKTDTVEFRVVDPPRVPNTPAWPNRPLFVSLVPLGGLGAGIAIAFLLGQLRPSVESRKQIRELTEYPLLGMVTRVETEAVRHRNRRLSLVFATLVVALAGAYLVQMIYYLFVSQAA